MKTLLLRSVMVLGVVAACCFLLDWGVWRVRVARGDGFEQLQVSRIVVAPLKGGREEYYADGTAEVRCSRSMLPQGGVDACWWVRRHRVVYDR